MLQNIQPHETLTSYQRTNLEKKGQGEKKMRLLFMVTYSVSHTKPATKPANTKNSNAFAGRHWYFQNDVRTALLTCHIFDYRK